MKKCLKEEKGMFEDLKKRTVTRRQRHLLLLAGRNQTKDHPKKGGGEDVWQKKVIFFLKKHVCFDKRGLESQSTIRPGVRQFFKRERKKRENLEILSGRRAMIGGLLFDPW